jgi:hypothetical protein
MEPELRLRAETGRQIGEPEATKKPPAGRRLFRFHISNSQSLASRKPRLSFPIPPYPQSIRMEGTLVALAGGRFSMESALPVEAILRGDPCFDHPRASLALICWQFVGLKDFSHEIKYLRFLGGGVSSDSGTLAPRFFVKP